jgi:hypothetical protein
MEIKVKKIARDSPLIEKIDNLGDVLGWVPSPITQSFST